MFCWAFSLFSRDFRGSVGSKNPSFFHFFCGFPSIFQKQGKEGQGVARLTRMIKSFARFAQIANRFVRGEQRAPENATHPKMQVIDRSQNLRFRCVAFSSALCSPLRGAKTHPKMQHTRNRRFWERSISCIFGCVTFSGALWRLPNLCEFTCLSDRLRPDSPEQTFQHLER